MTTEIRSVVAHVKDRADRPWLIVGKGPSVARFDAVEAAHGPHHLFTLNHACRLATPGDRDSVAHFTDLEALLACSELLAGFRYGLPICLPYWPHVRFRPGRANVEDFLAREDGPTTKSAWSDRPVLSYNSTVASNLPRKRGLPTVRVRFFSAVAAFNILAQAGLREIRTIGVDGGRDYGPGFAAADRLANGRASFDDQFAEIAATARRLKITHIRL